MNKVIKTCKHCKLPTNNVFKLLKITIKLRGSFHGKELKKQVLHMDGRTYIAYCSFFMDADDKYPFEHAFIFKDRYLPISWIACGDLEKVEEIANVL